jgi:hypothetical protein
MAFGSGSVVIVKIWWEPLILAESGRAAKAGNAAATWPAAVFALQMSELSLGHRQVA